MNRFTEFDCNRKFTEVSAYREQTRANMLKNEAFLEWCKRENVPADLENLNTWKWLYGGNA